jgi:hypothetical protein
MRAIFDHFAKLVVREGTRLACVAETEAEVTPDAQRADLFIDPDPARLALLVPLGLLGRICSRLCTLELFHRTPSGVRVASCVSKILALRHGRRRSNLPLPIQWVISSGRPETARRGLGIKPAIRWGPGIYRAPALLGTRLIVVSELPVTRDSLLLRLIGGAGSVLDRARAEIQTLPKDAPERCLVEPVLLRLWPGLQGKRTRSSEEEEFHVAMQDVVETWRQDLLRKGEERGLETSLLEVYQARFGNTPGTIAAAVSSVRDAEVLRGWLRLVAVAPAEEIAAVLRASLP